MARFSGKVVVVTGAASGIGEAAARRFASEGATLAVCDRDADTLEALRGSLEGAPDVFAQVVDVGDYGAVEGFVQAVVERFGRIDVVCNNAGTDHTGAVDDGGLEDWRKLMSTDLDGVFHMTRATIKALRETRGCIVNTSSVSGIGGDWNHSFYNAAKGAVTNFTRAVALDEGRHGVRVNAVNPTLVRTAMTADFFKKQELVDQFSARIALGRPAEPDDIAGAIAFLASDDARFVTGVNLPVDGGLSASNGQPPLPAG